MPLPSPSHCRCQLWCHTNCPTSKLHTTSSAHSNHFGRSCDRCWHQSQASPAPCALQSRHCRRHRHCCTANLLPHGLAQAAGQDCLGGEAGAVHQRAATIHCSLTRIQTPFAELLLPCAAPSASPCTPQVAGLAGIALALVYFFQEKIVRTTCVNSWLSPCRAARHLLRFSQCPSPAFPMRCMCACGTDSSLPVPRTLLHPPAACLAAVRATAARCFQRVSPPARRIPAEVRRCVADHFRRPPPARLADKRA